MPDERPILALWFRYGPAEHSELFHAMPRVVERLAERAEVHYYGMKTATPVPDTIRDHAIIHELPFKVDRKRGFDKLFKTLLWTLAVPWMARHAARRNVALIYMDENVPFTGWLATRFFRGNVAMTIADFFADIYADRHPLLRPFAALSARADRAAWKRLALVFTRARSTVDYLVEQGVARERVVPVYDPCDLNLYHPADRGAARSTFQLPADALILVHHGILHPNKGNDRILRALPGVCARFPRFMLLLVGDGPEKSALEKLTETLDLTGHVHFTGWLPELSQVNEAINAGDIGLVMRTGARSDDFHMTGALVHTMAAGLPVLAASLGGVREVIREGEAGLLFDPNDMEAFRAQLTRLLEDPTLRDHCGRHAHQLARQHFDLEHVAEQTANALLDRLDKPTRE